MPIHATLHGFALPIRYKDNFVIRNHEYRKAIFKIDILNLRRVNIFFDVNKRDKKIIKL